VLEVTTNSRTGSLVIRYNPEQVDLDTLIDVSRTARLLAVDSSRDGQPPVKEQPLSLTAQRLHRAFHEVDVKLSELSHGRWDLRSVVPITLGALALRQIIRDFGQLTSVPWYALAWYAFVSFWKLNEQPPRPRDAIVSVDPPAEPTSPEPE
jgi:hypothetical protein